MVKHKKGHDKDKYYHLAKEVGYRSRAAFKLIQINKRFDFLTKARVCVDLCAAPGGWCQVAAKFMPQGSIVLGIDLLPIRAIRNVKTIVSDITTAECRKIVATELQGWKADVVLCDGAPNIGAAYSKDAFVQNELVLAALKTATDHLVAGGTFCSKVYRSTDYNALIWVLQQLFDDVQAMKPNSSRSQSSEIFVVCLGYLKPNYIDPKLLDPNHVFKEVKDPGLETVDVMHKKYDKLNQRHRTGYDESLGMTLRATKSISEFVAAKEPIRMLTDVNEFIFTQACSEYLSHEKTSEELKICFKDLRVLGKVDFKKILKWRQIMRKDIHGDVDPGKAPQAKVEKKDLRNRGPLSEEEIQEELRELRLQQSQLERKEKKKKREAAAKVRTRQSLGMGHEGYSIEEDEELFSMANTTRMDDLDDINDVDLDEWEDADKHLYEQMEEDEDAGGLIVYNEDTMDDELEEAYMQYIKGKKTRAITGGEREDADRSKTAKEIRKSKTSAAQIERRVKEDNAIGSLGPENTLAAYVKALSGKLPTKKGNTDDVESDDSDDEDDGNEDEDEDEDENQESDEEEERTDKNGRKFYVNEKNISSQTADKWFSHPIFKERVMDKSNAGDIEDEISKKQKDLAKKGKKYENFGEEMIDLMPKTDKDIRKEKRKKAQEKLERKTNKRTAVSQEERAGFEVISRDDDEDNGEASRNPPAKKKKKSLKEEEEEEEEENLDERTLNNRRLIKEGMGKVVGAKDKDDADIEIVPRDQLRIHDERTYDSDEEEYDNHDRAMTLALGTLMLRKSRQKALVDASYNKYAWNDPRGLPNWFMDDEAKHNKPQVPVPQALLDQIKNRYSVTGTKEIKKVAEAKMRKRKRAATKLKAAKKQANAMAENSEMSERQKLKAIQKAMKTTKIDKPGKVYVVTRQTGAGSVGSTSGKAKGKLKFVDKRMKKDRRAMKAATKRKSGKKKSKH